ncbi:hypothetical protein glysoja_044754 [Glycine soja]|uniref:Uncharacterized protein n=1 Tax=Glycine soja TaxID=3848 RepID=A0A0B2SLV9_GLYSO|nr:hypothetical protein glysoja_044754 [Glycine soja]
MHSLQWHDHTVLVLTLVVSFLQSLSHCCSLTPALSLIQESLGTHHSIQIPSPLHRLPIPFLPSSPPSHLLAVALLPPPPPLHDEPHLAALEQICRHRRTRASSRQGASRPTRSASAASPALLSLFSTNSKTRSCSTSPQPKP